MSKPILLIVESKDFLANVIEEHLSRDFDCMWVSSVERAIEFIPNADAAVVSGNVFSGRYPGRGALLTALKKVKDVPIIALTTTQTSSARIELFESGADDVMTKPFNPVELGLRMKRLVKK